jgi:cell division septation protein DedD
MERKHNVLIYERREVWLLVSLGVALIAFAFTYGVHLGSRSGAVIDEHHGTEGPHGAHGSGHSSQPDLHAAPAPGPAKHAAEPSADRQDLNDEAREAPGASDEVLDEALHDAVKDSRAQVAVARQVELPSHTKSPVGGATESHSGSLAARYGLQVGSFATQDEADSLFRSLKGHGLKAEVLETIVPGKGTRHRVLLGGFKTKAEAEKLGGQYKKDGWVEGFLVVELDAASGRH